MEKFTCAMCSQLLEYHKFSKTQQKLSRKTKNGKCSDCLLSGKKDTILLKSAPKDIVNENMSAHSQIPGLYLLKGYSDDVLSKILKALDNVKWNKVLCRSVYSCGWEWVNYDGGKLVGWTSPPNDLAKAISLLEIPKTNVDKAYFNQIIFTKYHEHTYKCGKCQNVISAFNFPKKNNISKICNNCTYNNYTTNNDSLYEGMLAHTDRYELGPIVWGITLKGNGFMRFTPHKNEKEAIDVPANKGIGYCMTGNSRYKWKHQPYGHERISMTIRAVPCNSPRIRELGFSQNM